MSPMFYPGGVVSVSEYLFVDGGYLRKRLQEISRDHFGGEPIALDWQAFFAGFHKIFYYDCLPGRKTDEARDAYEVRAQLDRSFLKCLDRFLGFMYLKEKLLVKAKK